jgi:hypothetical protein
MYLAFEINIHAAMEQQTLESALRREAIAPIWEVNTAKLQQDSGDALAGLTEAERAAKSGLGATYDEQGNPVGQFRPVTLDLDETGEGRGTITTVAKDDAANTVGFDWDDSGFNKQVAWVKPNDGFLFLDRDSNGVVTSGKELFSNSLVSDDYKGRNEAITAKTIALRATDTSAKCLNVTQNVKKYDGISASSSHYEFNSSSRRLYAGKRLNRLENSPNSMPLSQQIE